MKLKLYNMSTGDKSRKIRQHAGKHNLFLSYYPDKQSLVATGVRTESYKFKTGSTM